MTKLDHAFAEIASADVDPDADFSLPGWIYHDREFFDLEMERVIRPSWQIVCHVNEITRPGETLPTRVDLTPQQVSDMQRMTGRLTADMIADHAASPLFAALPPKQQAEVLASALAPSQPNSYSSITRKGTRAAAASAPRKTPRCPAPRNEASITPGNTACPSASPNSDRRRRMMKQPSRPQAAPTSAVPARL